MGYSQVFAHVGINCQVPIAGTSKHVWPLVTGTFGGMDFIHSLFGEATDHISETSLTDLKAAITDAKRQDAQKQFERLRFLLRMVPLGQADLNAFQQNSQTLTSQGRAFRLQGLPGDGPTMTAQEITAAIYPFLALRDKIMKTVTSAIDKVASLVCVLLI